MKPEHRQLLEMFDELTYSISLPKEGPEMERLGFVRWVPPVWGDGDTRQYQITDAGREALVS